MVLKRHISLCPVGAIVIFMLHYLISNAKAELTPPYFNLATGRKIYATATCGMDTDGPELYCKLVGANTENDHIDYSVIQGQVEYFFLKAKNKKEKIKYLLNL